MKHLTYSKETLIEVLTFTLLHPEKDVEIIPFQSGPFEGLPFKLSLALYLLITHYGTEIAEEYFIDPNLEKLKIGIDNHLCEPRYLECVHCELPYAI